MLIARYGVEDRSPFRGDEHEKPGAVSRCHPE